MAVYQFPVSGSQYLEGKKRFARVVKGWYNHRRYFKNQS